MNEYMLRKEMLSEWKKLFSGKHLKVLRELFEISQEMLAEKLEMDRANLSRMESNGKPMPFKVMQWVASNSAYLPAKLMPKHA